MTISFQENVETLPHPVRIAETSAPFQVSGRWEKMERQADRRRKRETYRQRDWHTDRPTDRQRDRLTDRHTDRQIDTQTDRR